MNLRVFLYRDRLIEKDLIVTKDNYFLIRFSLENEIDKIRKRLKYYQVRGKVKNIKSKKPKVLDSNYNQRIKEITLSRRTISQALTLLTNRKFK